MFDYYIVIKKIYSNKSTFPEFFNCASTKNGFQVINDLSEYLENGKGVSDVIIDDYISFVKFKDWETLLNGFKQVKF